MNDIPASSSLLLSRTQVQLSFSTLNTCSARGRSIYLLRSDTSWYALTDIDCRYHGYSEWVIRCNCWPELAIGQPRIPGSPCLCVCVDRKRNLNLLDKFWCCLPEMALGRPRICSSPCLCGCVSVYMSVLTRIDPRLWIYCLLGSGQPADCKLTAMEQKLYKVKNFHLMFNFFCRHMSRRP